MTGGLHPYPEYKDSGLPWLRQIPEHWEVERVKWLFRNRKQLNVNRLESNILSLTLRGVVKNDPENPEGLVPMDYNTYQIFEKDDLVFKLIDLENLRTSRVGLVPERGIMSPAYLRLSLNRLGNLRFFFYQFYDLYLRGIYNQLGAGVRATLGPRDLLNLQIVTPSVEEQTTIERYLTVLERRIKRFIRNRRRLIKVLNEQKQAIINRAVTRGLDPNVSLKSSGIDWLGDIPKHWEVCRLRNIVSHITSGSRGWSSYAADEGPIFLRIANLGRMSLQLRFDDIIRLNLPETSEAQRTKVKKDDLLVSITAYIGSIAVIPKDMGEAYISQHVALCRPRNDIHNSLWLGYVLLSEVGQTHGKLSLYGGTKDGLSLNDVKNYPLLLPPRQEQDRLVEQIELKLESTNKIIDRARREIDVIREYRIRLIADVVTGKVDVRHLAPATVETEPEDLAADLDDEVTDETGAEFETESEAADD